MTVKSEREHRRGELLVLAVIAAFAIVTVILYG